MCGDGGGGGVPPWLPLLLGDPHATQVATEKILNVGRRCLGWVCRLNQTRLINGTETEAEEEILSHDTTVS